MGNSLKKPSPTKLARLGHFPPASQAARLAGPVFYISFFSLSVHTKKLQWVVCVASVLILCAGTLNCHHQSCKLTVSGE
jgi:hypothetical protein